MAETIELEETFADASLEMDATGEKFRLALALQSTIARVDDDTEALDTRLTANEAATAAAQTTATNAGAAAAAAQSTAAAAGSAASAAQGAADAAQLDIDDHKAAVGAEAHPLATELADGMMSKEHWLKVELAEPVDPIAREMAQGAQDDLEEHEGGGGTYCHATVSQDESGFMAPEMLVLLEGTAQATDPRFPTSAEKAALAGSSGAPGADNVYVTDDDPRNSNARTPIGHNTSHNNGGPDEIVLTGLSGLAADPQKLELARAGALVSTRKRLNFVEGANVTITVTDNPGSDRADVTIASAGGGGGEGGTGDIDAVTAGEGLTGGGSAGAVALAVDFGSGQNQVRRGDDAAYTNARAPTAHGPSHEAGSPDEISIEGLSGVAADAQVADRLATAAGTVAISGTAPTANQVLTATSGAAAEWRTPAGGPHKDTHQDGGADELNVTGLSGALADAQLTDRIKTAGGAVVIGSAPPAPGQVLQALSTTAAEWATPVGQGGGGGVTSQVNVGFLASNPAYEVPAGHKVIGCWIRPGAGGGSGGARGGLGNGTTTLGGGSGGSGHPGMSCTLAYRAIEAPAGDVLDIQIGAGGVGGGGAKIGTGAGVGSLGGDTTITNVSKSELLIRATADPSQGWRPSKQPTGGAGESGAGGAPSVTVADIFYRWPDRTPPSTVVAMNGCIGMAGLAGGAASTAGPSTPDRAAGSLDGKPFGSYPHFTPPPGAAGGAAGGTGGGGAGGRGGGSACDGDDVPFFGIPPMTGPGSGRGGIPAPGGAGSATGQGAPGGTGGDGESGSFGRGGGGGAGGAGGGGGVTGGTAGNGGAGGRGSDGAVILVMQQVTTRAVQTKNADFTAELNKTYIVDTSAGWVQATLPPVAGAAGNSILFKRVGATNHLVVHGAGADLIDGLPELHLTRNYEWAELVCVAGAWSQIA